MANIVILTLIAAYCIYLKESIPVVPDAAETVGAVAAAQDIQKSIKRKTER